MLPDFKRSNNANLKHRNNAEVNSCSNLQANIKTINNNRSRSIDSSTRVRRGTNVINILFF